MTWIQRIILPYVYPTKFSEATPNNKLPRHRTGWKQREPMQNKQAACTSGGIICTLHCTATAQTQTKFWAPPAWPQDASACRWINIREIHVLLLSDSIFFYLPRLVQGSLSLSPVFQTVCMREHGRTEELGEPGVHTCICMWGGFTCMVMISIGNWASSFTPKQWCKKELVLLRCLSLVHMITLILILVWYARVHSFFNIKK